MTDKKVDLEEDEEKRSVLLFQHWDKDQKIAEKLHTSNPSLNVNDPNWNYNLTVGDVEKRRIKYIPGYDYQHYEDVWFPIHGSIRKVFISLKIKRCSDINGFNQTVNFICFAQYNIIINYTYCILFVLFLTIYVYIT